MNKTNLLLVLLILFAAFFCVSTGVASAISLSDKYVGNTVVDLEWSKYGSDDFTKYKLYRDDTRIHTEFNRSTTFYRDEGRSKGVTYDYKIEVYNATGGLVGWDTRSVTSGDVHGTITQSTTWTAVTSPYTLTGSVTVEENVTLTIQSGVTVNTGLWKIRGTIAPLDTVTFNGEGIYLEHVDGYSIRNCVFDGITAPVDDSKGIELYECNNSIISNSVVKNYDYGIYLRGSDNTLTSNTANNNSDDGIYLGGSDNTLTSNTANNNSDDGIYLGGSDNTLTKNTANYNKYGIYLIGSDNNTLTSNTVDGIWLESSAHNTLTSNTANNCSDGIFLSHSWNNTLSNNIASNNGCGIVLRYGCVNNILTNNTANYNYRDGIWLQRSDNNLLSDNTANYNDYRGISLSDSSTDNTLTSNTANYNYLGGIQMSSSSYNTFTSNTVNYNSDEGIYMFDSSYNTFMSNTFNNNSDDGITLGCLSDNNTFTSNTANNNGDDGIYLLFCSPMADSSNHNTFTSNTANNNGDEGVFLDGSNNNTFTSNTFNNNGGTGIKLDWSSHNTLTGNTANNNNRNGISLSAAFSTTYTNNNMLTGNTANNNSGDGISLFCVSDNTLTGNTANENSVSGISLAYKCSSNKIENNVLVRDTTKGDSWGISVRGDAAEDNIFKENTVGCNYPTKISFHDYHEGFKIRGVEDPPEPPKPPEYLTIRQSISKYVEMENLSAETTLFLDFHYEDKDVEDIDEETLKVWKHNGTAWDEGRCADAWNGTRKLDTANNIVGVEVKMFCVFAPLAGLPVHNINTKEDFYTIQEAIDDSETMAGHTITVDLSYTEAGTKENICVDKELTIKANYYGCYDTVIEAADSGKHVIEVVADEVAIQGFVIKGATGEGKAGVYILSSTTDYTISQSIITDNNLGILCDIEDTHALVLENVKVWNNGKDGVRLLGGDLVIKGTDNEITNNGGNGTCVFEDGNVTIEGTTEIHDNGGWGIYTDWGNVDIHNGAMSSINRNGKGGIRTNGVKLPANFVVDDNGGPGIDAAGVVVDGVVTDTLILESVKVRNNNGDGIVVEGANLLIKGTGNEITNNGGNGTRVLEGGNVTIEGTTEIHDNGGWGIHVPGGNVDIHNGAMSSINRNGKGGIVCTGGLKLPANFVVDDNGGPGIVAGGGVVGGVMTDTLILESVKVRNNNGDGICVHDIVFDDGSLVIKGTGNEITNNGGNGTSVRSGGVEIEGTTEIHDNGGWGIRADGGDVDIHNGAMSSINRNGKGGILCSGGVKLPANFVVDDNGGPGIGAGGGVVGGVMTDTLILESVKVRNNNGDGIYVHDLILNSNLVIKGTDNEIINNGGNGTSVWSGGVEIEGATEIHDNGGWGILADGGDVDIHNGAMSSINRNGKGGILCSGGVKLPANFVVDDNGGPGIGAGGGVVGGVMTDTLILESVKVRNNKDDGIFVHDLILNGNLVIKGTGNEIINNGGNGTCVWSGGVEIEGTTEIHDNGGWGIHTEQVVSVIF